MTDTHLSRLANWLLSRLVPTHWRDSVAGDLLEERRRREATGKRAGKLWEVRAALAIGLRLFFEHRRRVVRPMKTLSQQPWSGWTERVWMDVRLACRALAASPGYASIAVLTLALSIGGNAAVFNIANWVLFRPVPGVEEPSALVRLRFQQGPDSNTPVSFEEIDAISSAAPALEGLTGIDGIPLSVNLSGPAGPARAPVEFVMSNYFDVVGARVNGRVFTNEEERGPQLPGVAVLSERLARRQFPDSSPIGQSVDIGGDRVQIVGVVAGGFRGTRLVAPIDVWMPIAQRFVGRPAGGTRAAVESPRAFIFFSMIGRLKSGESSSRLQE